MSRSAANIFIKKLFIVLCLFAMGCRNDDTGRRTRVAADEIFPDYEITAREGDDKLNIMFQFRDGDEEGRSFTLPGGSSVELDGQSLEPDSSAMTGSFYETQLAIDSFWGAHAITYRHGSKLFIEKFRFEPFSLAEEIPDTIHQADLYVNVNARNGSFVRIILIDTVFEHEGINRVDTIRNGRILIPSADLEALSPGPLQLELIREEEGRMKNAPPAGGRFRITYSLKREFVLR